MPIDVKILQAKHPDYDNHIDGWEFAKDTWNGGNAYIDNHLIKVNIHESKKAYEERRERTHLRNYAKAIARIYINTLWGGSEQVSRELEDSFFQTVSERVDRTGRDIQAFMKEVSQWSIIYGWCGILVMKSEDDNRAFWSIVEPQQITNWDLDPDGNLLWIRFTFTERVADPFAEPGEFKSYLTLIRGDGDIPGQWVRHNNEGDVIGNGRFNLQINGEQVLPITFAYFEPVESSLIGNTFFDDISRTNKTHFNLTSLLETAYKKNMNQLLMRKITPGMPQPPISGEIKEIVNTIDYPDEKPEYASLDPASWAEAREHLAELRQDMFAAANLQQRDATMRQQSGISKAVDQSQAEEQVQAWSQHQQSAEVSAFELTAAWENREFTDKIQYPRQFNILFESDYLDRFERVREQFGDIAPSVVVDQAVSTFSRINPDATQEQLDTVQAEVEAWALTNRQAQAFETELNA